MGRMNKFNTTQSMDNYNEGYLMDEYGFRIASNEDNSNPAGIIRLYLKTMFVKKFVSEQWILGC